MLRDVFEMLGNFIGNFFPSFFFFFSNIINDNEIKKKKKNDQIILTLQIGMKRMMETSNEHNCNM